MTDMLMKFFTEHGTGTVVLFLAVDVFVHSITIKDLKGRINNLEICIGKMLSEREQDETKANES